MSSTIALIMKMDSLILFAGLADAMPVWIADTPHNAQLRSALASDPDAHSITWFPLRQEERLTVAAVRACFLIDEEHDDDVCAQGYGTIIVFGAPYVSSMNVELANLGLIHIEPTDFGFVASK